MSDPHSAITQEHQRVELDSKEHLFGSAEKELQFLTCLDDAMEKQSNPAFVLSNADNTLLYEGYKELHKEISSLKDRPTALKNFAYPNKIQTIISFLDNILDIDSIRYNSKKIFDKEEIQNVLKAA